MPHYVVVYTGRPGPDDDRKALHEAWKSWFRQLGTAVVDPGFIFTNARTVARDGTARSGSDSPLTGCSVLTAQNLEEAAALVRGCPGLANAEISVYEGVAFT